MKKGIIATLAGMAVGAAAGAAAVAEIQGESLEKWKNMSDKHLALYLMMNQWVKVKQDHKSIAEYLERNGYKKVAIYGMNYVGETLLSELSNTNIVVKYAIDKNADCIYQDIKVVTPEGELDEVDAVIVTPITYFDEIEEALSEKLCCPVISMEDIVFEI